MKQKYHHYEKWEDYQHRMYDEVKEGREGRVKLAASLLTNLPELKKQMTRVTREWVIATEQNLTNPSINYQAFLGQTACSIWGDIKEDETREAWGRLSCLQRYQANSIADMVYNEWREQYEMSHGENHQMTLAEWWGQEE